MNEQIENFVLVLFWGFFIGAAFMAGIWYAYSEGKKNAQRSQSAGPKPENNE